VQGRLDEAESIYRSGLKAAAEYGVSFEKITLDLHFALALLYNERGDLDEANRQLTLARMDGDQHIFLRYRGYIARARILESSGDYNGALGALREAERMHIRSPLPDLQPVGGLIARVHTRLGRYNMALGWAEEQGLTPEGPMNYLTEFGHIVLARALLSCYRAEGRKECIVDAEQLLEKLLRAAEDGNRKGSAIEILVLLAMAYETQNRTDDALQTLEKAFVLGEPEGYLRVFADEGQDLTAILREARNRDIFPKYTEKVLHAIEAGSSGGVV
jgi:LuxR family maltose regulon positive regulatory protein